MADVILPSELRELIESGALAHLSTVAPDGSPQVSVIWVGLDGDDLVSGHMSRSAKVRNAERDPRVVLSLTVPRQPGVFLNPYATLRARATIEPGGAWDLLDRLAKVYLGPDTRFPAPQDPGGYVIRYRVERVGGVGPWVSPSTS